MAGPVPVASLVAVLLICIGVGLFCGTGYVGFEEVYKAFQNTENTLTLAEGTGGERSIKLTEVENRIKPVEISIFCLSGFMIFMVIFFLFQAFMATAASNKEEYSTQRVICGSRAWTTVSVVFSYILTILWILILPAAFYCFLIAFMIQSQANTSTLSWAVYGLKIDDMSWGSVSNADIFRANMRNAYIMFAIFLSASFLILVGMVNLSMSHSANLAHLRTGQRWQKYNETKRAEEHQLTTLGTAGPLTTTSQIALNGY